VRGRVDAAGFAAGRPWIRTRDAGEPIAYDLLAVAVGVNSQTSRLFEGLGIGYRQPKTAKTFICEFELGEEAVETHLGSSMHVFLMNLPRVDFAALIPKAITPPSA